MTHQPRLAAAAAVFCLSALYAGVTSASGFQFTSQSASAQGTSHANSAEAADAATQLDNPAGMMRLDGSRKTDSLQLLLPQSDYKDKGTVDAEGNPQTGGETGSILPKVAAGAELYLVKDVDDYTRVGLAVFPAYGAILRYKSDWIGRMALANSTLIGLDVNPSVAFKLDEHVSIGLGVVGQYLFVKQHNIADMKNGSYRMAYDKIQEFRADGNGALINAEELNKGCTQTSAADRDACLAREYTKDVNGEGIVDYQAGDFGLGWNFGALIELTDKTRLSLAYRSHVKHELKGDLDWDFRYVSGQVPNPDAADPIAAATSEKVNVADYTAANIRPDSRATLKLITPETATVGAYHEFDKLALMASAAWTRHSRLNEIRLKIDPVNGIEQGDAVIRQDWKDTWRYALGANYRLNDRLLLRTGIAYDESPVRSPELRHPGAPDSNRYWLSFGANYQLKDKLTLDLAYSYILLDTAEVNYTDPCHPAGYNPSTGEPCTGNGGTFRGEYETSLHMIGVQLNKVF